MKRRFATKYDDKTSEYYQKRIDEDYFKGYLCYLKMLDVENPMKVNIDGNEYFIRNDNYKWYLVYPDNSNYAITIMYDEKDNLVEWYFDVAKETGIENGIPYEDDLYLDLVIRPNGDSIVLDEDELKEALDKKEIDKSDYELAYKTLEKLQKEYVENFDYLVALTERLKKEFDRKKVL